MVEPPYADDAASYQMSVRTDIEQILATIVRTSIDKEAAGDLTEEELRKKLSYLFNHSTVRCRDSRNQNQLFLGGYG